jgi:hypothetical protein
MCLPRITLVILQQLHLPLVGQQRGKQVDQQVDQQQQVFPADVLNTLSLHLESQLLFITLIVMVTMSLLNCLNQSCLLDVLEKVAYL